MKKRKLFPVDFWRYDLYNQFITKYGGNADEFKKQTKHFPIYIKLKNWHTYIIYHWMN